MKKCAMIMSLLALATGAIAQPPNWIAQIGPTYNTYPGGSSDDFNYFGAFPGSIDDYPDEWDVVDPGYPDHAVALIFRGDENGENPTYPEGGLCWDIREPYDGFYKVWMAEVVTTDEGYAYSLLYDYDPFGYPLPADWICRLDTDGEINAGNYTDLSLYEVDLGHTVGYALEDQPQTGGSETWYIIAGVPEPAAGQLVGLVLGGVGIGLVRIRR